MNAIDRLQHNNVRDVIMREAVMLIQEEEERKARDIQFQKKGQVALDA